MPTAAPDDATSHPATLAAPAPCHGTYAEGFAEVAERFAAQVRDGQEIGAALAVYHRGRCVVDLWGGLADQARAAPWTPQTRVVVYSVTKGLAAIGLLHLADRGLLAWDAPVATYWPGFAAAGKGAITVRALVNHQAGLAQLDTPLTLEDCVLPARRAWLVEALERQAPAWPPGAAQAYHAVTWGLYVRELFARVAGEDLGAFLRREHFAPLDADVDLGTPAEVDPRMATIYQPSLWARLRHMVPEAVRGATVEGRLARAMVRRRSVAREAFLNPATGRLGMALYDTAPARRAVLPWASATASARGVARAYAPLACGGEALGRRLLRAETIAPVHARQGWAERDLVLQKPIGWSQGFVKDEAGLFSPGPEGFGHPGMGGSLGWCDPVRQVAIGYVTNRLDWRIRAPRTVALCQALYRCAPLR